MTEDVKYLRRKHGIYFEKENINTMDMNGELLLTYKTEFITNCCEQILGGALDAQGKSIVDLLILSGFIHKFSTLL